MNVVPALRTIILRDLDALAEQLRAYPSDAALWQTPPGMANSAGTLALHLAGNLRAYIGAELGHTGYVRDRPAEFATRGLPRTEILARVAAARAEVDRTLAALDEATLGATYPQEIAGVRLRTGDFLLHLAAHLTYHLGQLDYHRRAVTGAGAVAGMVSPKSLGM